MFMTSIFFYIVQLNEPDPSIFMEIERLKSNDVIREQEEPNLPIVLSSSYETGILYKIYIYINNL